MHLELPKKQKRSSVPYTFLPVDSEDVLIWSFRSSRRRNPLAILTCKGLDSDLSNRGNFQRPTLFKDIPFNPNRTLSQELPKPHP